MLRDGITGDWIGTFIGHKGAVWSARLSSCASLAATGSADFSAKVWDTFTGEQLHSLSHNHIVRAVAFPGGLEKPTSLATGGMEKKLRVWDLNRAGTGTHSTNGATNGSSADDDCYELGAGEHGGSIKSIVWSHTDNNILTTACDDKTIRWWDLRSQSAIASHQVDGLIGSCEMSTDGIDGAPEGTISVAAGKNLYFFHGGRPGHLLDHKKTEQEMSSVTLCGSQRRYVTGSSADTFVRVWDLDSGSELGKPFFFPPPRPQVFVFGIIEFPGFTDMLSQTSEKDIMAPSGQRPFLPTPKSMPQEVKTEQSSCGRPLPSHMVCGGEAPANCVHLSSVFFSLQGTENSLMACLGVGFVQFQASGPRSRRSSIGRPITLRK